MQKLEGIPWSFTIEFDADKAEKNGYELDVLYDYVEKNIKRYGVTRISHDTWKAEKGREVESQCPALCKLSDTKWFMQNIKSLVAFENSPAPIDCLEVFRRVDQQCLSI